MKRLFFIILILGLNNISQAQEARTITLNEAIDIALENNYQLKQAKNNLDLSETRVLSEKGDFLPNLNFSTSGSQSTGPAFNNTTGEFITETQRTFGSSLNLSVPIFNGFENINSLKSSQLNSESTREDMQWVRETVIFNTATRYLQVLLDQELLKIARENLEDQQKQLEQIRAQVEVGSLPSVDLYNQEATVANQELEVTNRENALSISRIQLIRQLQVNPLDEYDFVTPEINDEEITPTNYDLSELVRSALENRSDIRSAEADIKSLEYQLRSSKSQLYPSLNFNARLSSNYNDQTPASFNDQFFDRNRSRNLSLSLTIPIFNNWDRRTSVQTQEINYKNARLNLENTELQAVQEVNQAYTDYVATVKRLESTEKALRAAQRSYETEQQRYEVGASTLIELTTANANFVAAQSNRAQAIYNFIFQEKLLDYYIGKLTEDITLQ